MTSRVNLTKDMGNTDEIACVCKRRNYSHNKKNKGKVADKKSAEKHGLHRAAARNRYNSVGRQCHSKNKGHQNSRQPRYGAENHSIGNTAQFTRKRLSVILLASFPSYFTKMLANTSSISSAFLSSDEKSDCAISHSELCGIAYKISYELYKARRNKYENP